MIQSMAQYSDKQAVLLIAIDKASNYDEVWCLFDEYGPSIA